MWGEVDFEHYSKPLGRYYEIFTYSPAPMQFAVVFMDITDRKEADNSGLKAPKKKITKEKGMSRVKKLLQQYINK